MTMTFWPHYKTIKLESMDEVKEIFPDGSADDLNWCVLSTSGVHGSYGVLDDLDFEPDEHGDKNDYITVLIIHPRLVVLRYGTIQVTKADVPYLRGLVKSTLKAIESSQKGNL